MNIEAFNTDTLRKLVRNLQDENKKLKEKLDEANIPYEEINLFEQPIDKSAEYDPDQGGRIIHPGYITENMAKRFFAMFWEEKMSMPKEQEMVAIFLNVITDGIVIYVLNNKRRKYIVMNVAIGNGQGLM